MITTLILTAITNFTKAISGLMSTGGLPAAALSAMTYIVHVLHGFEGLFPVTTLITIIIAVVTFEIAVLLWKLIIFTTNVLRGSGA